MLKTFKRFYFITAIILFGLSIVPFWHFSLLLLEYFFWGRTEFNIIFIIPFMAVSASILLGFLLLPFLKNISLCKSHIIILLFSTTAFSGLSLLTERIVSLNEINILLRSRRMPLPGEVEGLMAGIPVAIRIHYYIFSIILIISVLSWLYNFAQTRYANGRHGKRFLVIQAVATICYALAYFFVRVVQYENFAIRHITWGSVINAAVCFMLAAFFMGLFSSSFLKSKIIPPLVSVLTGVLLYAAQYFMLDGQFYLYSESIFISFLLRILIVTIPGIAVYLLLKFVLK